MDEFDNIDDKASVVSDASDASDASDTSDTSDVDEKLSDIDDIERKKTKSDLDDDIDEDIDDQGSDDDLDDDDLDDEEIDVEDYENKAFAPSGKSSSGFENTDMIDIEDDDDDSDDDFDNYEKFQQSTTKNVLQNHYPELLSHNYEEIEHLSKVVRDEDGRIIDPFHKTLPFLSRYERARIIGERAKQLDNNAQPFVDLEANEIDSYTIAMKEFKMKRIPFIIKRPLPNGACEYWKFSDLEVI